MPLESYACFDHIPHKTARDSNMAASEMREIGNGVPADGGVVAGEGVLRVGPKLPIGGSREIGRAVRL